MLLYNTRTRLVERFRPRPGRPVTVYVCGITPYDTTHLGHAFTYVVFDVLTRHLDTAHGWPVRYVQNLTDIDDDILRRAAESRSDWRELGLEWTRRFTTDMARLGVRPPTVFPGATAYVGAIQRHVRRLLELGRAYEQKGSVYYSVDEDPTFGALARQPRDALLPIANERGNRPDDPNKRNPLDFVLWQAGQSGEPAWSSPWGGGRPGWHIECSTMAIELLGDEIDIHGGGADLVFPHHSCEISQAEPVTGRQPWVRFWAHTAMVRMNGRKMSKSLGNLVLAQDLLTHCEPDTLRLYLLRNHYRQEWEWDRDQLEQTAAWTRTLHAAATRSGGSGPTLDPADYGPRFTAAMDNDLDTPAALAVVMDLADSILAAPDSVSLAAAQSLLRTMAGEVLGLWMAPEAHLTDEARAAAQWPEPRVADPDGTHPLAEDVTGQARIAAD